MAVEQCYYWRVKRIVRRRLVMAFVLTSVMGCTGASSTDSGADGLSRGLVQCGDAGVLTVADHSSCEAWRDKLRACCKKPNADVRSLMRTVCLHLGDPDRHCRDMRSMLDVYSACQIVRCQ